MKVNRLISVIFLLAIVICNAYARPVLIMTGGVSIPREPTAFPEKWKTGYHGGLGLGYVFHSSITLYGYTEANWFSFDKDLLQLGNGTTSTWELSGNLKIGLSSQLSPYLLGGIGFARVSVGEVADLDLGSSMDLGNLSSVYDILANDKKKIEYAKVVGLGVGLEYRDGDLADSWADPVFMALEVRRPVILTKTVSSDRMKYLQIRILGGIYF